MNERGIRIATVVVDLFEAASAAIGAVGLVVGFMDIPVSVLRGTPFEDFTVPALLLGFVVGGSALVAAGVTAFARHPYGALASGIAGAITVGWIVIEVAMIGIGSFAQVVWGLVGVVMMASAAILYGAGRQRAKSVGLPRPA